ncbi:uncharacterized protein LOC113337296 isoform X2 [Papaver somniferum]|uniref:uncharacterized protein LOC113337296 isoform X2 n=1 Tax=Papaver somniferum TaxID=3469 RepID=UPI000E7003F3|nr:uncharacterized protein LOC113337296 isoform X2 [Papaver somniferum]
MLKGQSLLCHLNKINFWGVMAARLDGTFFTAGVHGFNSQVVGPGRANVLHGCRITNCIAVDLVGSCSTSSSSRSSSGSISSRINVRGRKEFHLNCCADHSTPDGHGLHSRRVDDKFIRKQPTRALSPLPYPQIFRYYSDDGKRLEDNKDATVTKRPLKMNGHGEMFERGSPLGFFDCALPDKLVVAVDVDEALNRFIADRYSSSHSVSEYHIYEFFRIWNCSRDEADIRVHEFFKTPYFKTGIHPLPGAQVTLHKLSKFCNLSVVTSRQNAIKDHTIEWLEKHFPGLFQEIHFGNHFALDGISRPKSEICRSLGAHVLIDDNPRYALECAEAGIRVLLFDYENSYPWSKSESAALHPMVTKVHNWDEVEQQLVSSVVSQ